MEEGDQWYVVPSMPRKGGGEEKKGLKKGSWSSDILKRSGVEKGKGGTRREGSEDTPIPNGPNSGMGETYVRPGESQFERWGRQRKAPVQVLGGEIKAGDARNSAGDGNLQSQNLMKIIGRVREASFESITSKQIQKL